MSEPSFEMTLDDARTRRDTGAQLADHAAHPYWREAAVGAIADLAATVRPFTADDVHDRIGPEPGRRSALGALLLAAARRAEIIPVGYRQSRRPEANARAVRIWQGTGHSAPPRRDAPREDSGSRSSSPRAPHRAPPAHRAQQPTKPGAGQWTAADHTEPCADCGRPAFLRDPDGHPRHRVDCTGGRDAA